MQNNLTSTSLDAPYNDSNYYLSLLAEQERLAAKRVAGVRTVLVVLSAAGMAYDVEGFRQKIVAAYPDAAVFFVTTRLKALGTPMPSSVDLLLDLTGPRQRQHILAAKRLRRLARLTIGRNAGLFRRRIYDRVFDEKSATHAHLATLGTLAREREVQKQVLALAGIALAPHAVSAADRGQSIALELPPLNRS